jgi:Mn-dependent DtxR family transcriptional regulator
LGSQLLERHGIVENFMKIIGVGDGRVLEETEKIEHMINRETIKCFENFAEFMNRNPDIAEKYLDFIKMKKCNAGESSG